MKSKTLEDLLAEKPRRPFRLVLDDGEELTIPEPRKASISGTQIACVASSQKNGQPSTPARLRFIRVNRVTAVESFRPEKLS